MSEIHVPRIGIPAQEKDVVSYLAALRSMGAEPVLVSRGDLTADLNGLLLPGGGDVDPARYNRENIACGPLDDELDAWQFDVLDQFMAENRKMGKNRPVLGVCRGHQLLNVYFGGTLIQHLPSAARHARDEGADVGKYHDNTCTEDAFLAPLFGRAFRTNSSHHQAVECPGEGLKVVAWSDDQVVEAFEHRELPVFGVQFHPERMCLEFARDDVADGGKLLTFFINLCRD